MSPIFTQSSQPIRALIIGGRGGIGAGFIRTLQNFNLAGGIKVESIVCTSRDKGFVDKIQNQPLLRSYQLDPTDEQQFSNFTNELKSQQYKPNLIFNTTGVLHDLSNANESNNNIKGTLRPENSMKKLSYDGMHMNFKVNTLVNGYCLKYLLADLADRKEENAVYATLSAKVGSITENKTGAWYSYRAAKAGVNMMITCASIEAKRTHPGWKVLAIHPGTVDSSLSDPFVNKAKRETKIDTMEQYDKIMNDAVVTAEGSNVKNETPYVYWSADVCAQRLFIVMNESDKELSGQQLDYAGRVIVP